MKFSVKLFAAAAIFLALGAAQADPPSIGVASHFEVGTDIDASAYNQITASTTKSTSGLLVRNSTDVPVKLATGAAASEVDIPQYIGPGETALVRKNIPAGTRLACRALNADAASGYLTVTLLQ